MSPASPLHPGTLLATGLGVGYAKVAPGTWGSLWGLPLAWGLATLPPWLGTLAWLATLPVAYWACGCGARHFQAHGQPGHDQGGIVVDEIAAVPLTLTPLVWAGWLPAFASGDWFVIAWASAIAFALFRLLDIAKPGPIGWCDQRGDTAGVLLDDLAAGAIGGGVYAAGLMLWRAVSA